jgi:hypothetical protein
MDIIAQVGLIKALADEILKANYFAQDAGEKLYHYRHGIYMPDAAASVKRRVKALLEQWDLAAEWSAHRAEEVVEYLRVDAPTLWESPPLNVINLKNGLLDLDTRELLDHSPKHLSPVQLPRRVLCAGHVSGMGEVCRRGVSPRCPTACLGDHRPVDDGRHVDSEGHPARR